MGCENCFLNPANLDTMNFKHYLEKQNNGDLDDEEWELLAKKMIVEQFDRKKRSIWERKLAENGIVRTPPAHRISPFWRMLAAASIVAAAAVIVWTLWLQPGAMPAQRLAANYLEQPFRLNQGSIRGDNTTDFNRGRALEAFNNRQYENAVRYLQSIEAEGQAKAADFFQLGLCLVYQPNPDYRGALNAFAAAQRSDPAVYADEINWFSGLCYLLLDQNAQARTALQRVANSPSSRNRDAALELIRALDR